VATKASPARARKPRSAAATSGDPVPAAPDAAPVEVVDIDRPPPGLPDLTFPMSPALEDSQARAARRRRRLRIELIGGGMLVLISAGTAVYTGSPAILLLLVLALAAVLAYELLVTNLE
jgi:hypothetical protein